jgi:hypothetical protein
LWISRAVSETATTIFFKIRRVEGSHSQQTGRLI